MKRRANPTVIGLFVVGALVLVFAAVMALAGGSLFQRKERAVMHFRGSIYGLQVGAPVVFRGVRLGQVTRIGVAYDKGRDSFSIPVSVEIDHGVIRGRNARDEGSGAPTIDALVQRGLRAQLAMQSILTGQLYVDLDFRPDRPADKLGAAGGPIEIPTVATPIQDLQNQFESLNIKQLVDDVSVIATSARKLISGPQLAQGLSDMQEVAATLKRITARLDTQLDPMLAGARGALKSADQAMRSTDTAMRSADKAIQGADGVIAQAGGAMARVDAAAARVDDAAGRLGALAAPDSPLLQGLRATTDELARSAAALRETTADDGATMQRLQRALKEVSQAARSLRELSDELERQPESLLRGKRGD